MISQKEMIKYFSLNHLSIHSWSLQVLQLTNKTSKTIGRINACSPVLIDRTDKLDYPYLEAILHFCTPGRCLRFLEKDGKCSLLPRGLSDFDWGSAYGGMSASLHHGGVSVGWGRGVYPDQ